MSDFGRFAAMIAAVVGLFTILGVAWKWLRQIAEGVRTIQTVPGQVAEVDAKVETIKDEVSGVKKDVSALATDHAQTKEQSRGAFQRLEVAQGELTHRVAEVEGGVQFLKGVAQAQHKDTGTHEP